MHNIRKKIANHKYLLHTINLVVLSVAIIIFRTEDSSEILGNIINTISEAGGYLVGVFLLQMFTFIVFLPFLPKEKDFEDISKHKKFYDYDSDIYNFVYPLIFAVVLVVLALQIH